MNVNLIKTALLPQSIQSNAILCNQKNPVKFDFLDYTQWLQ